MIQYHSNPTSNAEVAEIEWFYEDLQDLLELTPKKDVLFFLKNLFIYFNWRRITLKYCGGFCHTLT